MPEVPNKIFAVVDSEGTRRGQGMRAYSPKFWTKESNAKKAVQGHYGLNEGFIIEYELKEVRRVRISVDPIASNSYNQRYNFIDEGVDPTKDLKPIELPRDRIEGITFNK